MKKIMNAKFPMIAGIVIAAVCGFGVSVQAATSYGWGTESDYFGGSSSNQGTQVVKKAKKAEVAKQAQPAAKSVVKTQAQVVKPAPQKTYTSYAAAYYPAVSNQPKVVKTGATIVEPAPTVTKKTTYPAKTISTDKVVVDKNIIEEEEAPAKKPAAETSKKIVAEPAAEASDAGKIREPLPRFTQLPYHQPQPENTKAVEPVGREMIDNRRPQESKGVFTGDGMPRIHPHLGLLYVYDSNFMNTPNEVGDFVFVTSPGLTMEIGKPDPENLDYNRIQTTYTANIIRFLDKSENDAVDQTAELLVRYGFPKTVWGLQQRVETRSDSTVDIGRRSQRDIYDTLLTMQYDFSDKTYVDLAAAQFVNNYTTSTLSDTMEWTPQLMVNYKISPKVIIGAGPKVGWIDVERNPNQTYEQALFRVLWQATAKLAWNFTAGYEFRQWQDNSIGDSDTPVCSIGANWDPFDGTKTSLVAYRRNNISASSQGANYISTGVEASIRQRMFRKFYLALAGGYEHADYYSTSNVFTTSRLDDFYNIRPSVTYVLGEWGTVGAFYEYRRDDSNQANLEFTEHIYGLEASLRY